MRLLRMNQIPDVCDAAGLFSRNCVQNLLRCDNTKSSLDIKYLMSRLVPDREQKFVLNARAGFQKHEGSGPVYSYSENFGAKVANCSSCGFAGRLL
jgi:hypothetical protein